MNNILFTQLKLPGEGNIVTDPILGRSITLSELLNFGISFLFVIGILASLVFLLWGGLNWIMSGGDKEKLDKSRKTIIFAIIGLIVILLSVIIMNFIGTFIGLKIFQGDKYNSKSNKSDVRGYDCSDGSQTYKCGYTDDTKCEMCSPNPDCSTNRYSIAECSTGSGCFGNESCKLPSCPDGMRGVAYCDGFREPNKAGVCVSNCVPITPNPINNR